MAFRQSLYRSWPGFFPLGGDADAGGGDGPTGSLIKAMSSPGDLLSRFWSTDPVPPEYTATGASAAPVRPLVVCGVDDKIGPVEKDGVINCPRRPVRHKRRRCKFALMLIVYDAHHCDLIGILRSYSHSFLTF